MQGGYADAEEQVVVLTQAGVHEQGSYEYEYEQRQGSALMIVSARGMTGMVKKLLAAGAKTETTDEVMRGAGEAVVRMTTDGCRHRAGRGHSVCARFGAVMMT